ncbi:MAG: glycosyltransferase family 4 protein [Thermomicrobiales bacterium]
MKVLYCALAIDITRSHGGATHVAEVANGLGALGHDLWVIAAGGHDAYASQIDGRVSLVQTPPALAWQMIPRVRRIVRAWRPDVVMERFYTFAGGGIIAAHAHGIPSLLEVNAPIFDPPGSRKERIDRLTGRMMRRWATQQCRWADRIVTPLATTVPEEVRAKVVPLPWGANVSRFDPARMPASSSAVAALRARYGIAGGAPVIGFVGSFRPWHGAHDALRAYHIVRQSLPEARLLFVGDGPERRDLEEAAGDDRGVIFAGAVPYADVPAHIALCDVMVAPFAPSQHAPLRHFGFYWSPLKVFEAMAMAVPIVTTAIMPLTEIVDDAGVCVPEGDNEAMARAIVEIIVGRQVHDAMGANGRARVIEHYSWQAHCRHLDRILSEMVARP